MVARNEIVFQDFSPTTNDFRCEVLKGLFLEQKALPFKLLYDTLGSLLFERITQLGEYYLTRIERKIILEHRNEISRLIGPRAVLLDYGSGSGEKFELVFQALESPHAFIPIDISKTQLLETAEIFMTNYPEMEIYPVCVDFVRWIDLRYVPVDTGLRKVAFVLGSTIGNLEPPMAVEFLKNIALTVGPEGGVLVGVDLIKESRVLENAYQDSLGVTSQFNLNLLSRMNRELNADFNPEFFEHRSLFNPRLNRIEMHIVSKKPQVVQVSEFPVGFAEGETIHTENSYKYSIDGFHKIVDEAGWTVDAVWTDEFHFFSLHLLSSNAKC